MDSLADEFEDAISLLEQLYVLSQTEALCLETSSMAGLQAIVAAKEAVVLRIGQVEMQAAASFAAARASGSVLPADQTAALAKLRKCASLLIGRISGMEEKNRLRLETLKAEFEASFGILADDQKLHEAYGNSSPPPPHFSRLVD